MDVAIGDVQPPPPPPPEEWWTKARRGDTVQLLHRGAWWPMIVVQVGTETVTVRSEAFGDVEGKKTEKVAKLRPNWRLRDGEYI